MPRAARIHRADGPAAEPGQKRSNWPSDAERGTRQRRGYDQAWLKLRAAKLAADPLCELLARGNRTVRAVIPTTPVDVPSQHKLL